MRTEHSLPATNWTRLSFGLLLISTVMASVPGKGNSTSGIPAQPRKTAVVFAVSAESGEGSMDAVVMVDGKLLRAPYSDEQKDKQKSFGQQYFAPGKVYRLIFGGGENGSVTRQEVERRMQQYPCGSNAFDFRSLRRESHGAGNQLRNFGQASFIAARANR